MATIHVSEAIPRDEAIKLFRQHWDLICKKGFDKRKALLEMGYSNMLYDCFLCEYAIAELKKQIGAGTKNRYDTFCCLCPIEWPGSTESINGRCVSSYYGKFVSAVDEEKQRELAKMIANLPEKHA